jgi:hypothetical protein
MERITQAGTGAEEAMLLHVLLVLATHRLSDNVICTAVTLRMVPGRVIICGRWSIGLFPLLCRW